MQERLGAAEVERRALREQLDAAARDRSELFNVVSHELRTPLTVIAGYNRLLLGGDAGQLTEQQREFIIEADKSCRRLEAFLKNLLEASHEASVANGLDAKPNDLHATINSVGRFLRPVLDERDVHIQPDLCETARWARFDPSRIEQVLTNLISNASRYSKPGSPIRISTQRIAAAGHEHVEVRVVDRGAGIAKADLGRIFEPYVRGTGERGTSGLGLGLAICKRIIDAHGGSIVALAEPAGGTCLAFTLVAAEVPQREAL